MKATETERRIFQDVQSIVLARFKPFATGVVDTCMDIPGANEHRHAIAMAFTFLMLEAIVGAGVALFGRDIIEDMFLAALQKAQERN